MSAFLILLAVALPLGFDRDSDGDGLSDHHEIHKYGTDPARADSDGDGIPDGDWNERREHTYSVRAILHVLAPWNEAALNDDYQDARVLEVQGEVLEVEVVVYPFNTNAEAIEASEDWGSGYPEDVARYLEPGPTSNWDAAMREDLLAALERDGIDVAGLDDRTAVEQVSSWLMKRARYEDSFTTFAVDFEDGLPRPAPGLESTIEQTLAEKGRTAEEQWQRELLGKGMYETRSRGTCTSSAIYLQTALRAIGIPTRTIVCVPIVDASDPREVALVSRRLEHHQVRRTLEASVARLGRSWASHTFNEVFVGGRWQRLNYSRLGQNVFDRDYLGLMVHVHTFHDHAGSGLVRWGLRNARQPDDDLFGGSNPYSCVSLSDRFGEHASLDNPEIAEHEVLTIVRLYWYDDPDKHPLVQMRLDRSDGSGHLIARVAEVRPGEGTEQYRSFYGQASKELVLRAEGHPEVSVSAERGYWVDANEGVQDFYLRIPPQQFARMAPGVEYALVALDEESRYRFEVGPDVTIVLPEGSAAPAKDSPDESAADGRRVMTVTRAAWADHPSQPDFIRDMARQSGSLILLGHVEEWDAAEGGDAIKAFTQQADRTFILEADGQETVKADCAVGSVTSGDGTIREIVLRIDSSEAKKLSSGQRYSLRARNESETHHWRVRDVVVTRR